MDRFATGLRGAQATIRDLLERTSRTFALSIPLLPEPTQNALALAYLLFRVTDTVEDAAHWSRDERVAALEELLPIFRTVDIARARTASRQWVERDVTRDEGCRDLLLAFPALLEEVSTWEPVRVRIVCDHAARTAEGMAQTLREADAAGRVRLRSLPALRAYCYVVAGIVGELVTALFVNDAPTLVSVKETLVRHERAFGEALQLVNILKDERADAQDGRNYLPPSVPRDEVVALARADLDEARAYIAALSAAGAPAGYVAFTTLPVELAERALTQVEKRGAGAKVPRASVLSLVARIQERVRSAATVGALEESSDGT
ncbi:squalene/phytoene synthase family protein [Pendulispora albinea]|uniref:Squalene/phytoene synthase family protein n=1 Tax=Pendulispora albinea TaxID=2741071 RepID=A0ABZ2M678_9BACT